MKEYTYLLINVACIAIPLIASFYKKHPFYKEWRFFFPANLLVASLFIIWDYYFTKIGVWGFNSDYLTKIYLGNLPLEEILFFICIPYACVFTYFAFNYLFEKDPLSKLNVYINWILGAVLTVAGFFFIGKMYTSVTFILTGILLLFWASNNTNLLFYYLSYLAIIPFFFISNGILTGSFIEEPIVWYNNAENLGIRLGSIPIEDSIYGLLLIFLNIFLYRYFKSKATIKGV